MSQSSLAYFLLCLAGIASLTASGLAYRKKEHLIEFCCVVVTTLVTVTIALQGPMVLEIPGLTTRLDFSEFILWIGTPLSILYAIGILLFRVKKEEWRLPYPFWN